MDGDVAPLRAQAADASSDLEGADPEEIIAWAAAAIPGLAVTSSFGAESAPLLHLVSRVAPELPVLFLETGFHFDETLDYRHRLARELGLVVEDIRPEFTVEEQAARFGEALYARDPDACCAMRKKVPLQRALKEYGGWISGVRRCQTPERAKTPVVDIVRQSGRWVPKVSPIAAWSDEDVQAYQLIHELPAHPLVRQGYLSIGCAPCTKPVAEGEDARAGRWAGTAKTECGIHT